MLQSGLVIYLLSHAVRDKKRPGWSLGHFTIPILSPFSSVVSLCAVLFSSSVDRASWGMQVEQESSLIGTRTLTVLVVVVGVTAYFLIRTWLLDPRCKT